MIRSELLIEEFRFTCAGCAHAWSVEYDVRRVEDGHGHERDYFFRHHHPSDDPTAPQTVICPVCGSTQVRGKLTAQRVAPPVALDTAPSEGPDRG